MRFVLNDSSLYPREEAVIDEQDIIQKMNVELGPVNMMPKPTPWDSPGHVILAVVIIFVISPVVICGNALLVISIRRFKRLQNASNFFLLSLASADLGVGLLLPFGLYFELSRTKITCVVLCLLPYSAFILVCCVSILSITAISLDRYTSLASPLRYNNIITHRTVVRYVSIFWIYSLLLSSTPILYWVYYWDPKAQEYCSFDLVFPQVRIFLFFALFAPCVLVIVASYTYVYVIARYHARAIFTVELSFRNQTREIPVESRYGRTLVATVGMFLLMWLPIQVCMLSDLFQDTHVLTERATFYFGMVALSNSAVNPWVYGYRNSEFRVAFLRILEDIVPKLSDSIRRRYPHSRSTSCVSHVRLCNSPNRIVTTTDILHTTYLQPPTVETTGVTSPFLTPTSPARSNIGVAEV